MTSKGDPSSTRWGAWLGYARAWVWRLRGARVGTRSRVGADCEVTWPAGVSLGQRVVLERGVVVKVVDRDATVVVEDHAFIGRGTILDISQGVTIGQGTMLAPGCFVTDHNHGIAAGEAIWSQPCVASRVRIGTHAWLGANVIVLPGVTIGDGAVVAAGAVVTKDVAADEIVGGVPARSLGFRKAKDGHV